MSLKVNSETGQLKKVIIHRPDYGIEKVTPDSAVELLYEDIVYLPKMIREHDAFSEALEFFIGRENVIEFEDLLIQLLHLKDIKKELIQEVKFSEKLSERAYEILLNLEPSDLAATLITGSLPKTDEKIFNPLPNLIFTRDLAVVINDHLLISKAAKIARKRESLLCNYIFSNHPSFSQLSLIKPSAKAEITIEGGDVMMLADGHLMVATSERTTEAAVEELLQYLFNNRVVKAITTVNMPKLRFCMHLDTIFTKFSDKAYLGFQPLVSKEGAMQVLHHTRDGIKKYPSLEYLLKDLYPQSEIIYCGDGKHPYQEREQWTDACNLFAVKDGVAFTYDRNYRTNRALQTKGYHLTSASEIVQQFKEGTLQPEEVHNTIITIPSSELSRARGGAHCMTLPILRN